MRQQHAVIHPSAKIAEDVEIGPWTIIGENVEIGAGTKIASHVVIEKNTTLGKNNQIYSHATLGADPQHLGYKGEQTALCLGDYNVVREFVSINRGTEETGLTQVGDHNYFMSYSHIAHDCEVGNHVIFANLAQIAGHVKVGDHAVLGAYAGIHQYVTVGAYSFLGRATKVYQDILPYMLVTGNAGCPRGLNLVGLRRQGFSVEVISQLKKAFQIIFRSGLKQTEVLAQLRALSDGASSAEIAALIQGIESSSRGIAKQSAKDHVEAC